MDLPLWRYLFTHEIGGDCINVWEHADVFASQPVCGRRCANFWLLVPLPSPILEYAFYNEVQGTEEKQIAEEIVLLRVPIIPWLNKWLLLLLLVKELKEAISFLVGLYCSEQFFVWAPFLLLAVIFLVMKISM